MKTYRIGNTINVRWYITRNYIPEDFDDKTIEVKLYDQNDEEQVFQYTYDKGVIKGTFSAQNQDHSGVYRLVLVENADTDNQTTLDYLDAFKLTDTLKCTNMIGDDSTYKAITETINLQGNIYDAAGPAERVDLSPYAKTNDVNTELDKIWLELNSTIESIEDINDILGNKEDIEQNTALINALQDALNDKADITTVESNIASLNEELDRLEEKIDNIELVGSGDTTELLEKLNTITDKVNALDGSLNGKVTRVENELTNEINNAKETIEQLSDRISRLVDNDTIYDDTELRNKINTINSRLATIDSNITSLNANKADSIDVERLKSKDVEISGKIDSLQIGKADKTELNKLNESKIGNDELNAAIRVVDYHINQVESQINGINANNATKSELSDLHVAHTEDINTVNTRIGNIEHELHTYNENYTDSINRLDKRIDTINATGVITYDDTELRNLVNDATNVANQNKNDIATLQTDKANIDHTHSQYVTSADLPTFKTINGETITGTGDITVAGDGGTVNIDLLEYNYPYKLTIRNTALLMPEDAPIEVVGVYPQYNQKTEYTSYGLTSVVCDGVPTGWDWNTFEGHTVRVPHNTFLDSSKAYFIKGVFCNNGWNLIQNNTYDIHVVHRSSGTIVATISENNQIITWDKLVFDLNDPTYANNAARIIEQLYCSIDSRNNAHKAGFTYPKENITLVSPQDEVYLDSMEYMLHDKSFAWTIRVDCPEIYQWGQGYDVEVRFKYTGKSPAIFANNVFSCDKNLLVDPEYVKLEQKNGTMLEVNGNAYKIGLNESDVALKNKNNVFYGINDYWSLNRFNYPDTNWTFPELSSAWQGDTRAGVIANRINAKSLSIRELQVDAYGIILTASETNDQVGLIRHDGIYVNNIILNGIDVNSVINSMQAKINMLERKLADITDNPVDGPETQNEFMLEISQELNYNNTFSTFAVLNSLQFEYLGTSSPVLYAIDTQGNRTNAYNIDPQPGFWFNENGKVVDYNDDNAVWGMTTGYIYDDERIYFNCIQKPNKTNDGDSFETTLYFVNPNNTSKEIKITLRYNVTSHPVTKFIDGKAAFSNNDSGEPIVYLA